MNEIMNAIRNLDNKIVEVQRQTKNIWKDTETSQKYKLHEDIELIY